MLLRRLVLEDFGLYRGVQELDLVPRCNHGCPLPIVLIGGKNGAGKSTVLEAVLLGLYGKRAIGERVRDREYLEYLFHRMHRQHSGRASTRAAVTVEFELVREGVRYLYEITRSWVATNATYSSVGVTLDLRQNGRRLDDFQHARWDEFVKELIPPSLSELFFFDGEKIQRLAEQQSRELGRSVKSLLGLDLVERLSADLRIYVTKQANAVADGRDRMEVDRLVGLREDLLAREAELHTQRCAVQASAIDPTQSRIEGLEENLRSEGREFARLRDGLAGERDGTVVAVRHDEGRLRELAAGTLPFALCRRLLEELRTKLVAATEGLAPVARERVSASASHLLERFVSGELAGCERIDPSARERAAVILRRGWTEALEGLERPSELGYGEELSAAERARLLSWMDSALRIAAPEARRLADGIEEAARRLQEIELALAQVPEKSRLKSMVAELNDAHRELGGAEREAAALDEAMGQVRREVADLDRRLERLRKKVREGQEQRERVATVGRCQRALKEYLGAVTKLKLRQLEREATQCFAVLCRKTDFVQEIRIDPESFKIALLDGRGGTLPGKWLSSGERQMLAVALLWALGRTSGRPLPVIIDTPLARLDSDHRRIFVERYLPRASHQVLVLSTDTEVDEAAFAVLEPAMSHAYRLQFDGDKGKTSVDAGYFWRSGP